MFRRSGSGPRAETEASQIRIRRTDAWLSLDNVTYNQFGVITSPLREGFLTSNFASASGWDTVDTLSVNLTESSGVLTGTSASSAQQGATLCLIDSELIAYETATLVSAYNYDVSGLSRGLYGSQPTNHSSGALFYRLDGAVLQSTLPDQYVGQTLYFKFQSFNVFGRCAGSFVVCRIQLRPNRTGIDRNCRQRSRGRFFRKSRLIDIGYANAGLGQCDRPYRYGDQFGDSRVLVDVHGSCLMGSTKGSSVHGGPVVRPLRTGERR